MVPAAAAAWCSSGLHLPVGSLPTICIWCMAWSLSSCLGLSAFISESSMSQVELLNCYFWGHAHFLKRACLKEACQALTCCCANVCGWLTHGHVAHNAQQLHGKMCLKDLCTQKQCVCTWPSGFNMWGLEHAEELHMLWMHVDGLPLPS